MTKNIFKNAIIFILILGVLLYFLYIFDFKDFLEIFDTKEHLVNLYKPNKVFYKEDKIYLIDTNHIYDENNPRIFDSFFDFQNFILGLEEKHLIKLPLNRQDILEGNNFIKQYEYNRDESLGKPNFKYFKYSNNCEVKSLLCGKDILKVNKFEFENIKDELKETNLFKDDVKNMTEKEVEDEINKLLFDLKETKSGDNNKKLKKLYSLKKKIALTKKDYQEPKKKLINDDKLKEYREEKCNINLLDDDYCSRIEKMGDQNPVIKKGLSNICTKKEFKKTDVCKDFNRNKWDDQLFKDFCVKKPNNYDMNTCLKGEYFKENLLDF